MVENRNQFYLYDRWYYLINETENKLIYSSNIDSKTDCNKLEIDKENNKINIIYISDNKTLGKLEINYNNPTQIKFHYSQYECYEMKINEEIYENIIYELYATRSRKETPEKTEIKFTKKKKLNKLCYREPNFPMDKRIKIDEVNFKTEQVKNFQQLVDYHQGKINKIIKLIQQPKETKSSKTEDAIKTLEIPETIMVYDRPYSFVKQDDQKLLYRNENCEITNLEIKLDTTDMRVLDIKFVSKELEHEQPPRYIIEIFPNEIDGLTARYHNCKAREIYINDKKVKHVKIKSATIFNCECENIETKLKLEIRNKSYDLVSSPINSSLFQDKSTNMYKIYCNYYLYFQSMIPYIPDIYKHVKNSIFKEKELIKK